MTLPHGMMTADRPGRFEIASYDVRNGTRLGTVGAASDLRSLPPSEYCVEAVTAFKRT